MEIQNTNLTAGKQTYAGLFLISLATLMYEILLTRLFSVTLWYHFAFMAISLAMFGMTVGALVVFLLPGFFKPERTGVHLAGAAWSFSAAILVSVFTYLLLPLLLHADQGLWLRLVLVSYPLMATAFVFSGISVTLALTRFPLQVSRLYASDLAGAAFGCIATLLALSVADGLTAIVMVAAVGALAALFFARAAKARTATAIALVSAVLLGGFSIWHTVRVQQHQPVLRLAFVKFEPEPTPLLEKWNSFARFVITGDAARQDEPFGAGISETCPSVLRAKQLMLTIDGAAETILTGYNGDPKSLQHLRYEVTNLAHYLRHNAKVLVVGIGGGRDILSALAFNQRSVTGVELNGDIIKAVNGQFGDFTGHLDRDPRVKFVNDEARSYLTRSKEKFDIIQVSLIDTWASTAAGGLSLSESTLYTVDAWKIFLSHLTEDGVLSFSRWDHQPVPGEVYRMTSLANAALMAEGIANPRDHIIIIRRTCAKPDRQHPAGVATMLVSRKPFSAADVAEIKKVAAEMHFDVVLTPSEAIEPVYAGLASGAAAARAAESLPLNVSPTTDDNPYFFQMVRCEDAFNFKLMKLFWNHLWFNGQALMMLALLLVAVTVLCACCMFVPLAFAAKRVSLKGCAPLFAYFASIGLGFMFIELSQMQRLSLFLGHPTYTLSVILFTLLLSGGIGSASTSVQLVENAGRERSLRLALLVLVLAATGLVTPGVLHTFQAETTIIRVGVAIALLAPIGLFMGMAFPIGMKTATDAHDDVTPWLWAINGAMSVLASVLCVLVSLAAGITSSYVLGTLFYAVAALSLILAQRGRVPAQNLS